MPIYEYVCESCGAVTEALRKISDPPLEICPACGQSALRKKVSAAAFRLKGGGWYETDFKTSDRKKNLFGEEGKSAASADKASEKPSDTAKTSSDSASGSATAPSSKSDKGSGSSGGGSSSAA